MKIQLVLCLLLVGCTRSYYVPDEEPATKLNLCATKTTNGGAPLYVVLKFTDFTQFLVDDYHSVAECSITSKSDTADFSNVCVIPGKSVTVVATPASGQSDRRLLPLHRLWRAMEAYDRPPRRES